MGDVDPDTVRPADYIRPSGASKPQTSEEQLEALIIRARAKHADRANLKKRWKTAHYWFGFAAALLAFLAGSAFIVGFSDNLAAALAFASGLFATVVGFFDFSERAARLAVEKSSWFALCTEGQALQTDWTGGPHDLGQLRALEARERTIRAEDAKGTITS